MTAKETARYCIGAILLVIGAILCIPGGFLCWLGDEIGGGI